MFLAASLCASRLSSALSFTNCDLLVLVFSFSFYAFYVSDKRLTKISLLTDSSNIKSATGDELTLCSVCHAAPEIEKASEGEKSQTDGC